jgi:hypothetical protein
LTNSCPQSRHLTLVSKNMIPPLTVDGRTGAVDNSGLDGLRVEAILTSPLVVVHEHRTRRRAATPLFLSSAVLRGKRGAKLKYTVALNADVDAPPTD